METRVCANTHSRSETKCWIDRGYRPPTVPGLPNRTTAGGAALRIDDAGAGAAACAGIEVGDRIVVPLRTVP